MNRHDVEALKERIGDRVVIASVSGGKDSTAMCLHLRELGIPYRAVHMDTGWEHADTDRYVREVLPEHIGPIETITAEIKIKPSAAPHVDRIESMLGRKSAMVRLVLNRAAFPGRTRRFCTDVLKVGIMKQFLQRLESDPVNAVGVRAAESEARSKLPEWEWWSAADCEQWRPLIRWSDQDVVDIHRRAGVPPNPLYLKGASRVGCWPCIFARKAEIRNIAATDPDRIAVVDALESAVRILAAERRRSKGEEVGTPPTWFQAPISIPHPETGKRYRPCWPIRRVAEWALTRRGGRQVELFAPPAREWGCMRWGVCDTGADES